MRDKGRDIHNLTLTGQLHARKAQLASEAMSYTAKCMMSAKPAGAEAAKFRDMLDDLRDKAVSHAKSADASKRE